MLEVHSDLAELGVKVFYQGHADAEKLPSNFRSFDRLFDEAADVEIPRSARANVTAKTPLCYIYTSGTTG